MYNNQIVLKKVEKNNWILLLVFTLAAWLAFSLPAAEAVFAGGAIANIGFWLLKRDLTKLFDREKFDNPFKVLKIKFFIKYYIRLSVLGVILFFIVRYRLLPTMGLLLGLSNVLLSVGLTMASEAKNLYFTREEA